MTKYSVLFEKYLDESIRAFKASQVTSIDFNAEPEPHLRPQIYWQPKPWGQPSPRSSFLTAFWCTHCSLVFCLSCTAVGSSVSALATAAARDATFSPALVSFCMCDPCWRAWHPWDCDGTCGGRRTHRPPAPRHLCHPCHHRRCSIVSGDTKSAVEQLWSARPWKSPASDSSRRPGQRGSSWSHNPSQDWASLGGLLARAPRLSSFVRALLRNRSNL